MKRLLTLALAIVPLLATAQDDLYFVPKKKNQQQEQPKTQMAQPQRVVRTVTTIEQVPANVETVDYGSCSRDENEYNRRYSSGDYQYSGGAYANDTVANDSNRRDMDDSEMDYSCSRRIVRFHTTVYYSPYYWDLMYHCGAWDYLYDPWDPWYWHYGWGYGWSWGPWDCWYGCVWGWSRPCGWAYWGWGPGWHPWGGGVIIWGGGGSIHRNYRPRGTYVTTSSAGRFSGGNRVRTNPSVYASRGNSLVARSSGVRGSGLQSARDYGRTSTLTRPQNRTTGEARSRSRATTDYTGGRMSTNRYGQRGNTTTSSRSNTERYSVTERASARSYNNQSSSSRSYTPTYSTPSRSSSSSSSYGGASRSGGFSGGGGGARSGGFGGGGGGFGGGGARGGGGRR